MNILLVDQEYGGHHDIYINNILKIANINFYVFINENIDVNANLINVNKIIRCKFFNKKNFFQYIIWVIQLSKVCHEYNIDAINFLYGDSLMRYFGFGFLLLKKIHILITFHNFYSGFLRKISYLILNKFYKAKFVVHNEYIKSKLENYKIDDIEVCMYPSFFYNILSNQSVEDCKNIFKVNNGLPTIGIVGLMAKYKQIDKFLKSIVDSNIKCNILIQGDADIGYSEYLNNYIRKCKCNIVCDFNYLSYEKYLCAISASDIVYAVYEKRFEGASGPMTDGIAAGKVILSGDHGAIGYSVNKYHLGITCDSNDCNDIKNKFELISQICESFNKSDKYAEFRRLVMPNNFILCYENIYNKLVYHN